MAHATKTLAAVDAATLSTAESAHRRHLGASEIGEQCARRLWYKFRWVRKEQFEPRLLRLFARGHREEQPFAELLTKAGMQVWLIDKMDDKEERERYRLRYSDGHFGGTPDGVILGCPDVPNGQPALLEFKTASYDKFQKFKEDGVMATSWRYFVQAQLYMKHLDLDHCLFSMVCKDDDALYFEVLQRDDKVATEYLKRGDRIIRAEEPPERISSSPGHFQCKMCPFKGNCHFNEPPEINCRTCAHSSVGPNGTWTCARGHSEVAEQKGCEDHLYDPRFFDDVEVLGGSFEHNWLHVKTSVEEMKWGPHQAYPSARLYEQGFLPF